MTREEVELRLKQIGFKIRRKDTQSPYATIWLNDEQVGVLKTFRMEMALYIPSVIGKTWTSIERIYFLYPRIANANTLKDLKRDLLDSANRWAESLRQERKANVQKYFKDKQESHRLMDLAWKSLYPAFKKARGE